MLKIEIISDLTNLRRNRSRRSFCCLLAILMTSMSTLSALTDVPAIDNSSILNGGDLDTALDLPIAEFTSEADTMESLSARVSQKTGTNKGHCFLFRFCKFFPTARCRPH